MFKKLVLSFSVLLLLFIISVPLALAAAVPGNPASCTDGDPASCTDSKTTGSSDASVHLSNPLGNIDTPQQLIGNVINAVLGFVGSLALLMFVYGGLTWMTSSGSAEKIKKGRDIIVWSAIGLAIVFMAYAAVRILILNLK